MEASGWSGLAGPLHPSQAGLGGDPEQSQTLTISIEPAVHACPVLVFAGELDLSTVPKLERTLLTRLASNAAVVVDLTRVTFIDSSGIGLLVKAFRAGEGTLQTVIARGSQVDRVLSLAGVDRVLPLFTDRMQAIGSPDGQPG